MRDVSGRRHHRPFSRRRPSARFFRRRYQPRRPRRRSASAAGRRRAEYRFRPLRRSSSHATRLAAAQRAARQSRPRRAYITTERYQARKPPTAWPSASISAVALRRFKK